MRYVLLALMALLSVFTAGGVFGAVSLFGLAPDLMLCFMASVTIMEKSLAGMLSGAAYGLLMDTLFSTALGFYAIPYAVCGAALFFVCRRMRYIDNYFIPAGFAAGAFIVKDVVSIFLTYVLGHNLNCGYIFVRFTLLSAVETGLLMMAVHLLLRWLYKKRVIKTLRFDDMRM